MLFRRERPKNPTKTALLARRFDRGFNDLLSYLMLVDANTVLHKDGALSCHFSYIAPDLAVGSHHSVDYHTQTWQQGLQRLGDGWMVETNVMSQPFEQALPQGTFPDHVSALISDERRLQFDSDRYFSTRYVLSVTYRPSQMMEEKLRHFALNDTHKNTDKKDRDRGASLFGTVSEKQKKALKDVLASFHKTVDEFIGYLNRSMVSMSALTDDHLITFLSQCITGTNQGLKAPYQGAFLDSYLSFNDFIGGFSPIIGDRHIRVLAIDDLPPFSYPCILDSLGDFPVTYRWSTRFVCLDPQTARAYLKKYERNWSSKAIGMMGVLRESLDLPAKRDVDAQRTADAIRDAQVDNAGGQLGYGFYNSNLILTDTDPKHLDYWVGEITHHIQKMDFKVRNERINAVESYLGSLPCHGDYNLRKMLVDTHFVSHVLPTSTAYQGESIAPCPKAGYKDQPPLLLTATKNANPFILNLHVGDVGHTAILGATGKGKTTLVGLLMASHRQYAGSRIIVLDKDRSNEMVIKALGGDYYDLSQDTCQLGVFSRLDVESPASIDTAVTWLKSCVVAQGVALTPDRQTALRDGVMRLAKADKKYKTLNHLTLQEPALRTAINAFNQGRFKTLLNGTRTSFANTSMLGIEMSELVKSSEGENANCLPVIKAIINELEALFVDKQPTLLVLEEAWLYLRHPLFQEKLEDWFKTLRKSNVSVIFISQEIADIVKSPASATIQNSCMTRIFLPNSAANESHVKENYRAFGLTDSECDLLQQAIPKQDYFYASEKGKRLFRLDLGDVAKAFLCINEKKDQQAFLALQNTQPDNPNWWVEWLTYHNLHEWVSFAEQHYGIPAQKPHEKTTKKDEVSA